jgi:hypothetical protein
MCHPEAFREATPVEREALQHWTKVCSEIGWVRPWTQPAPKASGVAQ